MQHMQLHVKTCVIFRIESNAVWFDFKNHARLHIYHVPCQFAEKRTPLMNIKGFLRLNTCTRNNKQLMSSRSAWRKQWLWKAFHLAFSISLSAKMILELAGWHIGACISLQTSRALSQLRISDSDLSLIFWVVGRMNWRHGLWTLVLT